MAGFIIDAGGAMANSTLPEKSDVFERQIQDNLYQGGNSEDSLWDENDKLVYENDGISMGIFEKWSLLFKFS